MRTEDVRGENKRRMQKMKRRRGNRGVKTIKRRGQWRQKVRTNQVKDNREKPKEREELGQ